MCRCNASSTSTIGLPSHVSRVDILFACMRERETWAYRVHNSLRSVNNAIYHQIMCARACASSMCLFWCMCVHVCFSSTATKARHTLLLFANSSRAHLHCHQPTQSSRVRIFAPFTSLSSYPGTHTQHWQPVIHVMRAPQQHRALDTRQIER